MILILSNSIEYSNSDSIIISHHLIFYNVTLPASITSSKIPQKPPAKAVSHGIHYELNEVSHEAERDQHRRENMDRIEAEHERRMYEGELPDETHVKLMQKTTKELRASIKTHDHVDMMDVKNGFH